MSIMSINFSDAQEPKVAPAGEEFEIRVVEVKTGDNKHGDPYFIPVFEIPSDPSVKEFSKYYSIPTESMDAKKLNNSILGIKRLCEALGVPLSDEFNTDSLIGMQGWAILGIEKDAEYGDKNYVKKFLSAR